MLFVLGLVPGRSLAVVEGELGDGVLAAAFHRQGVADGAGEELDVDVEGELRLAVGRDALDAGDAVVFGLVVVGPLEGVLEEGRIAAAGHGGSVWVGVSFRGVSFELAEYTLLRWRAGVERNGLVKSWCCVWWSLSGAFGCSSATKKFGGVKNCSAYR
jgi:hypothetical protein